MTSIRRLAACAVIGFAFVCATAIPAATFASGSSPIALKIDHASLCGPVLAPMESAFAEAGLPSDYGGPHATGGTHMALLGFEDGSYLELIAPQTTRPAIRESPWGKAMAGNAGPCAWAVATSSIEREVGRFKALRIATRGPEPGSRTKPDRTVIHWKAATVGKGIPGATLPFLIEDVTPRRLRVQPSRGAANTGITGIQVVVLGVKRLEPAIALFRKAYGWGPPALKSDPIFGAKLASFPGEPVILAAPLQRKGSWLGYRTQRFGECPAALLLATRDLQAATKRFGLVDETTWPSGRIAWFPSTSLRGARIGVLSR